MRQNRLRYDSEISSGIGCKPDGGKICPDAESGVTANSKTKPGQTLRLESDVDNNRAYAALDRLREALIQLMSTNSQFMDAIQRSTSAQDQVRTRFDLARQTVEAVLRDYPQQPRLFTKQLKVELFESNPTCAICGQAISTVDDAHVDHIKQYWTGGETIPDNARLTHRYCNMARPRGDAVTSG